MAFLIVGALLGWGAASGHLTLSNSAVASVQPVSPSVGTDSVKPCCDAGANPAAFAALNAHNQKISANLQASGKKPNILVLWGDDIGVHNISAYNHGVMGYQTPNIDRIAKEGALFTDAYAQQSCTAGRASFILGQHPFRTGLLTIGMPGSPHGIPDWAPTTADLLKEQGYARGSSARTTSATGTRTCRPCTGSTSSTATSIT